MRPTRQSLTERFAIPERTMVARNETEPWNEERGRETTQRIHSFCDRGSFLLRTPVLLCSRASLRDAIPQTLRLPRRCAPRNDTELKRFWVKIAYFARILRVLRSRQRRRAVRSATDAACPLRVLRSRQRRRRVGRVSSQGISRFLPNFRRLHFAHTML